MTNINDLEVSKLASEAEDSYDYLDDIYKSCLYETFELNNYNIEKIKEFRSKYNDLFYLLCQISDYITQGDEVSIEQKITIRDGDIYEYDTSKKESSFTFFQTPEVKNVVRRNCSSEELADKFDEAYNLTRYFCSIISSASNYVSATKIEEVPYSKAYGEVEKDKNYYLVYRAKNSREDKIAFEVFWKDSLYDALDERNWTCSITKDSKKDREKFLKQIWHSKPIGLAVRDFNQKINLTCSAASDVEEKILNNFSEVLVANEV